MNVQQQLESQPSIAAPTVRLAPIAWFLALTLLLVAPGAISLSICISMAEATVGALFLFRVASRDRSVGAIEFVALAWLITDLSATALAYRFHWGTASPYPQGIYGGGFLGPVHLLIDQIAAFAAFFAAAWAKRDDASAERLAAPLVWAVAGVAALGITEQIRNMVFGTTDPRLQATFTNPNLFSAALCLTTPLVASFAFQKDSRLPSRIGAGALAVVLAVLMLLTQSRGGILGLCAGMTYFGAAIWASSASSDQKRAQRGKLAVRATIVCAAAFALLGFVLFPKLLHQSRSESDEQRATVYHAAIAIIESHPVAGIGMGGFPAGMAALHLTERNSETPSGLPRIPSIHLHAHDLLLQSWVERGLFGAATTVAFVIWLLFSARTLLASSRNDPRHLIALGAFAGLIAWLVQNISDYTLWFAPVNIVFWFVLGIAVNCSKPASVRG